MTLIEQIRRDREAGTPPEYGAWFWHGNGKMKTLSLATQGGGRHYVMDFERWGMQGAQPRFQPRGKGMIDAKALLKFQVGDGAATGMEEAKADDGVYRYDVVAIDNPDARRIARVPAMEEALLAAMDVVALMRDPIRSDDGVYDYDQDAVDHFIAKFDAALEVGQ